MHARRLRIMHVMEATDGGTRRWLEEVLPALVRRNLEIELVCSVNRCASFRDAIEHFRQNGIRVTEVPMVRNIRPFQDLLSLYRLWAVLKERQADIYHFHSAKAGALGRLAATLAGRRQRVYSPHAYPFLERSWLKSRIYLFAERLLGGLTDHTIAVSDSERLIAIEKLLATGQQVTTIENGVPTSDDRIARPGTITQGNGSPRPLRIGFIGRLEPQKQPLAALRVARQLADRGLNFKLDMVGDGALTPACQRLSRALGLEKQVRFHGRMESVNDFYRSVDVLLHTARYEGLAYVLLDAMSWGVPIVAYDVPGVRDAVSDGESGLLAPLDDERQLGACLLRLASDVALRARLGQLAQVRVRTHFRLDVQVDQLVGLYTQLASEREIAPPSARRAEGPVGAKPTRVLFVSHTGTLGGAERSMLDLVRSLSHFPVSPLVACPVPSPMAAALRGSAEVVPFSLGFTQRPRNVWQSLALLSRIVPGIARLSYCVLRRRIDLVHANSTVAQLCAGPAAFVTGVPAIWHWRDFYDFPRLNRTLARLSSTCVAISAAVHEFARRQIGNEDRLQLIVNGVALEPGAPSPAIPVAEAGAGGWRDAPQQVVYAVLAQLVPHKGHAVLIDAFSAALEQNADLRLVLAYPLDSPLASRELLRIQNHADQLGCSQKVTYAGYVSSPATMLLRSDCAVVPSLREPFGRVAVESMLAGKPVIASNVDGLAKIVVDGVTGILVPPGAVSDLAQALLIMANSAHLRESMGAAGRVRAQRHFSMDRVAQQMLQVYQQALRLHRPYRLCRANGRAGSTAADRLGNTNDRQKLPWAAQNDGLRAWCGDRCESRRGTEGTLDGEVALRSPGR